MPTEETQAQAPDKFAERKALIAATCSGISEAIVKAEATDTPPDLGELVNDGLTLLYCGLMALTEIAQAQAAMADMAKRDIAAEVDALARDKAAVLTEEQIKGLSSRSFIGQKS